MRFADIIGHRRSIEVLRRMARRGRVPHALLFVGPEGVGKRAVAEAFFQYLNCPSAGEDSCGLCPSCEKVKGGRHPDLHLVVPEGEHIKIQQVRELIERLYLRPLEARWRGAIIEGADRMTKEAGSAFLKTLEEPPPSTLIVLITSRPEGLLPTISSRCQRIRFYPLSDEEVREVLERKGISPGGIGPLLKLADGSPGKAMELCSFPLQEMERWMRDAIAQPSRVTLLLEGAEELSSDRKRSRVAMEVLLASLRDEIMRRISWEDREVDRFLDLFWEIMEVGRGMEENVNPRLAWEKIFLEMSRCAL